jgi:hypothetical protein
LAGGAAEQPAGSARAQHGWASQRAVARRGGQEGPDAGSAVVTVSAFVSGIRCPVSGASVRCPRGACPRDRCPVRASERPGVQCPAPGVRALRRPRCPTAMRSRGVAVGRPPHGWDGWGRGGHPAVSVTARRLPEVGAWPRSWRRPCWASGGSLGRRGRWLAVGQADRERLDACEVRPSGTAAGGDHATWSLCEAWAWVGWSRSASGLHCGLSLRPQRGRNLQ